MRPLALTVLAVLPSVALGYDFRSTQQPGNSVTYHLDVNSMDATRRATIVAAAAAWDAGDNRILRGADWIFSFQTLTASQSVGLNNGRNEVYMRDNDWFDDHAADGALGGHFNRLFDDDVVFNTSFAWCITALPSHPACRGLLSDPVQASLGAVAVHEWGHVIGFDHEDDLIASMNRYYPNGGDLAATAWRIHEDDAAGLMDLKGDDSTGFNLLLGRWRHNVIPDNPATPEDEEGASARIIWEPDDPYRYEKLHAFWDGPDPGPVRLVHTGTGSHTVLAEWRVSTNDVCTSLDYLVGTRTPTSVVTDEPYVIDPNSWNFSAVPVGTYFLCARVDPNNTLAETSEADNTIVSREAIIEVY